MKMWGHFRMLKYFVKFRTKAIGLHGGDSYAEISSELHHFF